MSATEHNPESHTMIRFDLLDEMTEEEVAKFEAAAERAGSSLTDFFLDKTIRLPQVPNHAA